MKALRSQSARHSLHLSIDPSPFDEKISISPDTPSPSSSAPASAVTSGTSPTSDASEWVVLSVLCLYDFESHDPDHLPFRKNQILDIVKMEDSGWWAAVSPDGKRVGWIPRAFLQPLSAEMVEKLRTVREELRVFEYGAEQLYNSAPISHLHHLYEFEPSLPSPSPKETECPPGAETVRPASPTYHSSFAISNQDIERQSSPRLLPPPSPQTPMPQPPLSISAPVLLNRPAHLVPVARRNLQRSRSAMTGPSDSNIRTKTKILAITGSQDALAFHNAKQGLLNQPWYLRPNYTPDQLSLDNDLNVKAGTLNALVEKLTAEPLGIVQEANFWNAFLMTFRTFAPPDKVFDLLTELYRMDPPSGLTQVEFLEWKEKRLSVTQKRVMTVLRMWLEDHGLLQEEPHIAQRLTDFVVVIKEPAPLAMTAKYILQSIENLTFATPNAPNPNIISPRKRRKSKPHKNDILKLDPADIAEQLCLLEHALYVKVRPQECLNWPKTQTGKSVENLHAFCSTHDKVASWVKMSVLDNEAIGRRADTIDLWIKVAEKCRHLNNFASMSAIINALSSTAVSRLHLTWAHVGRKSHLDGLLKYNEPTGGFSGYRGLLQAVEGPCAPFIGMFLVDLVHIQDQFSDNLSPTAANPDKPIICFTKRQRWFEVITAMLKHQSKSYNFPESESTRTFIETHLQAGIAKDQGWFWTRSQEVQHSELAHADIRRGLVEAGF